ncbi:TetR/AcrR family transcriptional regulator [Xanthomonas sp. XNM01]|uniref:TetR/AcrR family transcriptional regulator n=1 Tax=Xanthomonas sp. XNM01 TaxID=2769289 RepID=UPI00177D0C1E|nr:TetR/AcrR family transcriptional regulator [Xanthomonas sp. XNM01]MBD9368195.1 TetR/AcrR family transcriptional regulator [Xanthomonas sp. XNM01]
MSIQSPPGTSCDARDERVHAAVRALIAEQGVQISMDAVAARAGCSKQTLYARYGSKQALMLRVIGQRLAHASLQPALTAEDLRSELQQFAESHLARLGEPDAVGASRLITAQASHFPEEVADLFEAGAGALVVRIASWLQQAMRRGLLRHDDPHCAAELLLGMLAGLDLDRQHCLLPHRDADARARWARFAVDGFLRAFAPPAPRQ